LLVKSTKAIESKTFFTDMTYFEAKANVLHM